jgi:hypothetical protein
MRQCNLCNFRVDLPDKAGELSAMADHHATHNPTPAQWTEAHHRIQEGKERARESSKRESPGLTH